MFIKNLLIVFLGVLLMACEPDTTEGQLKDSLENHLTSLQDEERETAEEAFNLGNIRLLNLDYKTAEEYFAQAVELRPDNEDYKKALADARKKQQ